AGLLCGLLHGSTLHSQVRTLWTVEFIPGTGDQTFSVGTYGVYQAPTGTSSVLFGSPPTAGPATEVVVEQHVLPPGASVPLPYYGDGIQADESEVFWTAHIWQTRFNSRPLYYFPAADVRAGDRIEVGFTGRHYDGGHALIEPYTQPL